MIPLFKFKILGHSMDPTFKDGDMVLINRLSYFFKKPKIGNVVVLNREKFIIKRIAKINPSAGSGNKYYVVGDNQKQSTDSRNFGWVDRKEIVGKVILKI